MANKKDSNNNSIEDFKGIPDFYKKEADALIVGDILASASEDYAIKEFKKLIKKAVDWEKTGDLMVVGVLYKIFQMSSYILYNDGENYKEMMTDYIQNPWNDTAAEFLDNIYDESK